MLLRSCFVAVLLVGCSSSAGTSVPGTGGSGAGTGGVLGSATGGATAGASGGTVGTSSGGVLGTTGSGGAANTGSGGAVTTSSGGNTVPGTGGAITASGGSTGTGGSSAGTGTGGATGMSPPGFFVGGYVQSGPWMGYLFTYSDALNTGTTISPTCTSTGCTPPWGAQACVTGTVAKDAASASYVGVAFHVINPKVGAIGTWPVAGTGLLVSVSNAPAGARVQVQEMPAPTNDQRYCAPLPVGGTGVIPFSSFKTWCWGDPAHPSKTLAPGTRIHEASISIPGNSMAAVPVDFCLLNMVPQ